MAASWCGCLQRIEQLPVAEATRLERLVCHVPAREPRLPRQGTGRTRLAAPRAAPHRGLRALVAVVAVAAGAVIDASCHHRTALRLDLEMTQRRLYGGIVSGAARGTAAARASPRARVHGLALGASRLGKVEMDPRVESLVVVERNALVP